MDLGLPNQTPERTGLSFRVGLGVRVFHHQFSGRSASRSVQSPPRAMNNFLPCIILSVLLTSASAADYQQLPSHAGGAGSIGPIQTVADDFQFSSLTPIRSLSWWGGYLNPTSTADTFSVRLFADNAGRPDTLLHDFVVGSAERTATGDILGGPILE